MLNLLAASLLLIRWVDSLGVLVLAMLSLTCLAAGYVMVHTSRRLRVIAPAFPDAPVRVAAQEVIIMTGLQVVLAILGIGVVLGPAVSDLLSLPPLTQDHASLHEGTRILLAVSVMAVALRYPFRDVRRRLRPVAILLLVVMPAMAIISAGLGWLVLGLPLATAALLGAAVAPTDPVLASSVLTGDLAERDLPARDREILSLESGANDGLGLPLVIAALAVAGPLTATEAIL